MCFRIAEAHRTSRKSPTPLASSRCVIPYLFKEIVITISVPQFPMVFIHNVACSRCKDENFGCEVFQFGHICEPCKQGRLKCSIEWTKKEFHSLSQKEVQSILKRMRTRLTVLTDEEYAEALQGSRNPSNGERRLDHAESHV